MSKKKFGFYFVTSVFGSDFFFWSSDPGRQFDLAANHIQGLRRLPGFGDSRVIVYVERNLGFEAGELLHVYVEWKLGFQAG